jgi:hypothetical protein
MRILSGMKFQKKYIAFFAIVPLIAATAIITVPCPVCEGTGFVSSNPEMDNVQITDIQSKEGPVVRDACGMFLIYNFEVTLSVENDGPDTATGWLLMYLIDFKDGKVIDQQYTVIEIPGSASWDVTYEISFQAGHDQPRRTEVQAKLITGEVPCETCNATGRVSINTWPVVNALKDNFLQLHHAEKPWAPPSWPVDDEG